MLFEPAHLNGNAAICFMRSHFFQHNMDVSSEAPPAPLRCSEERLTDAGMFLLENGHSMFLWLGQASPPDLIQSIFNLPSLAHLQGHMVRITALRPQHISKPNETVSVFRGVILLPLWCLEALQHAQRMSECLGVYLGNMSKVHFLEIDTS